MDFDDLEIGRRYTITHYRHGEVVGVLTAARWIPSDDDGWIDLAVEHGGRLNTLAGATLRARWSRIKGIQEAPHPGTPHEV